MSKTAKIWLIVAAVLTALGLLIFVGAVAACGMDFAKLGTVAYTTETYEVSGGFDKISIDVSTTEVELKLADDGRCEAVCYESDKVRHSARVESGTLVIDTVDTRKWWEYLTVSFDTPKMTLYLPESDYGALKIETDTGDIAVPSDFSFGTVDIDGDTSDVQLLASVSGEVKIELSTGRISLDGVKAGRLNLSTNTGGIKLNNVRADGDAAIETDTGEVQLANVLCVDLSVDSATGNVELKAVTAGTLAVESNTGNVRFDGSDAQSITVNTDTGNVTGTLLSDKIFFAESDMGSVKVPKTSSGGRCEITTDTGNINISIKPSSAADSLAPDSLVLD